MQWCPYILTHNWETILKIAIKSLILELRIYMSNASATASVLFNPLGYVNTLIYMLYIFPKYFFLMCKNNNIPRISTDNINKAFKKLQFVL